MPLPCIKDATAPRCQAKSKRTALPCQNPAAFGCKTCRLHGAHRSRNSAKGENHYNYKHGEATKTARAEHAKGSAELRQLVALGNEIGLFDGEAALRGRQPKLT